MWPAFQTAYVFDVLRRHFRHRSIHPVVPYMDPSKPCLTVHFPHAFYPMAYMLTPPIYGLPGTGEMLNAACSQTASSKVQRSVRSPISTHRAGQSLSPVTCNAQPNALHAHSLEQDMINGKRLLLRGHTSTPPLAVMRSEDDVPLCRRDQHALTSRKAGGLAHMACALTHIDAKQGRALTGLC